MVTLPVNFVKPHNLEHLCFLSPYSVRDYTKAQFIGVFYNGNINVDKWLITWGLLNSRFHRVKKLLMT